MKKKFILMFAIFSIMNSYSQSNQLYYNAQIGNDSSNDFKELLKTIESNNAKADKLLKNGNDLVLLKKFDEAIVDYTKAIEINNNFAAVYYNRGLVEFVLDQKESGCLDLRKADELGEKDAKKMIQKYCN